MPPFPYVKSYVLLAGKVEFDDGVRQRIQEKSYIFCADTKVYVYNSVTEFSNIILYY